MPPTTTATTATTATAATAAACTSRTRCPLPLRPLLHLPRLKGENIWLTESGKKDYTIIRKVCDGAHTAARSPTAGTHPDPGAAKPSSPHAHCAQKAARIHRAHNANTH
jgi:hypothetical protein